MIRERRVREAGHARTTRRLHRDPGLVRTASVPSSELVIATKYVGRTSPAGGLVPSVGTARGVSGGVAIGAVSRPVGWA